MSAREPHRSRTDRRSRSNSSVVGSTVKDVSSRLRGRGLPPGGIREQDRLEVAEGALPDSTIIGSSASGTGVSRALRIVAVLSGLLAVVLIAVAIAVAILSGTNAFLVTSIEAYDTEHVTADEIARLANIGDDVTLLNVDNEAISAAVKRNPWVGSVDVERVFPDTLRLRVHERELGAVVAMSSGGVAWLLGNDNVWVEPLKFEVAETESVNDAALDRASSLGVILISDVPNSVNPAAGSECSDEAIQAVMEVANQLSQPFKERIVCYSASSEDDISVILSNGVEISLGSASNIDTKESVASRLLDEFSGQITYINVRIPSRPTYRRVDSEYVREGTGATGSAVDQQSIVPKVKALEDEENEEGSENSENSDTSETSDTADTNDATATSTSETKGNSSKTESQEYGDQYAGQYGEQYGDYGYYDYGYDSSYDYTYGY